MQTEVCVLDFMKRFLSLVYTDEIIQNSGHIPKTVLSVVGIYKTYILEWRIQDLWKGGGGGGGKSTPQKAPLWGAHMWWAKKGVANSAPPPPQSTTVLHAFRHQPSLISFLI